MAIIYISTLAIIYNSTIQWPLYTLVHYSYRQLADHYRQWFHCIVSVQLFLHML